MGGRGSGLVDAGLAAAALRLVQQSLGVVAGERVLVVYDEAHATIAKVFEEAIRVTKSEPLSFELETLAARPHVRAHAILTESAKNVQATILLFDFRQHEIQMRAELVALAAQHRLRHAHMVGVGRASIVSGFSVDVRRITEKARDLLVRLRPDSRITVKSAAGTNVTIALSPTCRWLDLGCVVAAGKAMNLPGGELVTCPASVDGTYVADGTLGDAEGALTRTLAETPLAVHFAAGRVKSIECPRDMALARAVSRRIADVVNLDRVGNVVLGVNLGLSSPCGDIASDQKIPGVHLSLGETFATQTGAAWSCASWIGLTSTGSDADVDGA
ncbi:MAG TPA: hypothetical protein VIF62_21660, partial [Labilithrix sp.]